MNKLQIILLLILIPILLNSYIFEVDKIESVIFISSALAVDLSNNYFDRQLIERPTETDLNTLNKSDVPFFDEPGLQPYSTILKDFSDYAAYITIGSTLFVIYEKDTQILLNNLIVFSEIMITQSAVAKWTKTLTHRYRPFVYDDEVSDAKKKQRNSQHSFFSMHSSTTFAAATFGYFYYSKLYGQNLYVGTLLYGSATATAALRVAAAQHFPSDVLVGALVGSSISYLICKYHNDKKISISFGVNSIKVSYKF